MTLICSVILAFMLSIGGGANLSVHLREKPHPGLKIETRELRPIQTELNQEQQLVLRFFIRNSRLSAKIRGQANRISKHTNKSGDLIPRGAGVHEGKQVTVGEHILDDYFPIEKSKSRFISFTESFSHAFKYGKKVAQLNLTKLRKAIKSGELKGVYIISPRKIRKFIKNNTFLPEILKERALRLTKSDAEYLIIGNIPKDFYEIIK